MPKAAQRIAKVTLDERTVIRRSADIEHDRAVAISDLLEENSFVPASGIRGRSISIWRSPRTAWCSISATPAAIPWKRSPCRWRPFAGW
jgi:hypothetical protein